MRFIDQPRLRTSTNLDCVPRPTSTAYLDQPRLRTSTNLDRVPRLRTSPDLDCAPQGIAELGLSKPRSSAIYTDAGMSTAASCQMRPRVRAAECVSLQLLRRWLFEREYSGAEWLEQVMSSCVRSVHRLAMTMSFPSTQPPALMAHVRWLANAAATPSCATGGQGTGREWS
jgi:hypothetical protein